MSDAVDVHVHLYPDRDAARWSLATYDVAEYGPKNGVDFANASGLVEEVAALCGDDGPLRHAVVVNLFARDLFYERAVAALDPAAPEGERAKASRTIEAGLGEAMLQFNEWLLNSVATHSGLTAFVAVDPTVLTPAENIAQLFRMADQGARGVKLHPVLQRFQPDDPRMDEVYETCVELDLTVLSHSGANAGTRQYARPGAFAPVLRAHPRLRLVLAHLGGGAWHEAAAFAEAFPDVSFDLSEIIEWLGAAGAPNRADFVQLIRRIGADRVMLGSDYPWYDPLATLSKVGDLPGLSAGEKEAIIGGNARRILGI
ncbi:MAG TPA: amidohydrolase family protein [Acidimicrobiales bacterium]|nr:amidohydrolase family protein [Acidimicrobiales bacterium]